MPDRKPCVLIADDNAGMREIISDHLAQNGYEPIAAADGHEALARAAAHPPDIALVDVVMPGPSGMELAAQLKERQPGLEVILVTAFGSTALAVEAMHQGVFYYLAKPLEMERLLEVVHQAWTACQARTQVCVGKMIVDLEQGHATLSGEPLKLTPLESRLLACLARRQGQVVGQETLWQEAWGYGTPPDDNAVWMAMSRLRRKIGAAYIGCAKGQGYFLETAQPTRGTSNQQRATSNEQPATSKPATRIQLTPSPKWL